MLHWNIIIFFKENIPFHKSFWLIKYCYRFFVLWLTHYINAITCTCIITISAMYNFLFYVIFVKRAVIFWSFWGLFFLYENEFSYEYVSQYSLWSAFVHVPRFSLQKWLITIICLLCISLLMVVFTKPLSLEIST